MTEATLRDLRADDIPAAEHLRRLAFGTLFGLPDPASFRGDADLLRPRAEIYPDGGIVAEIDGALIGVAMANDWGSLGLFGPVAVHPDHWRHGIARHLVAATMPRFERWGSRVVGLFTFPERPAHVRLYQHFGFWPRGLTAIMAKPIATPVAVPETVSLRAADPTERAALIAGARELTQTLYDGLDLSKEITMVLRAVPGDAIVLTEGSAVTGLAICHCGRGSEGGTASCYVKFAAVRSGTQAPGRLTRLLAACNALGHAGGATTLTAGVNLGRMAAYRHLIELGFRTQMQGVALHNPWTETYDRPEIFALDDWR